MFERTIKRNEAQHSHSRKADDALDKLHGLVNGDFVAVARRLYIGGVGIDEKTFAGCTYKRVGHPQVAARRPLGFTASIE